LSAILALGGRPNSLRASSPTPILAGSGLQIVFTHTHNASQECHLSVLAFIGTDNKDGASVVKMTKRIWLVGSQGMVNPSWIQPPSPCVSHMRLPNATGHFRHITQIQSTSN
jgi:hypothetical protein